MVHLLIRDDVGLAAYCVSDTCDSSTENNACDAVAGMDDPDPDPSFPGIRACNSSRPPAALGDDLEEEDSFEQEAGKLVKARQGVEERLARLRLDHEAVREGLDVA